MPSEQDVLQALGRVMDPDLDRDIVSLGFVKDLAISDDSVSFTLELTTPVCPMREKMREESVRAVKALPGVGRVDIKLSARVRSAGAAASRVSLPGVSNTVAIASGKGGVGKSTVSANLSCVLAASGAKVGLMDVDAYGPSVPTLMGVSGPPRLNNEKMVPPEGHGVKIMSMGFFLGADDAVILRGPMLHRMVEQFLSDTDWGELDYLIVDLPPGTGDIQLSLCQLVPLSGAVIVSTPQEVAVNVARKASVLFERLRVPVLGLIENMSGFVCPKCGHREEIFGAGKAAAAAREMNLPLLGEIPLGTAVRESGDEGRPITVTSPESPAAAAFSQAARALAAGLSVRSIKSGA